MTRLELIKKIQDEKEKERQKKQLLMRTTKNLELAKEKTKKLNRLLNLMEGNLNKGA
jgi:hypothetical protein